MANFKVGDRVRVVYAIYEGSKCVGHEATITALWGANPLYFDCYGCTVEGQPAPPQAHLGMWWGAECCFAPLTPPAADTWAADAVRKVTKPQHVEPVAPCAVSCEEHGLTNNEKGSA